MAVYLDIETLDFFQDAHIKALQRDQQLAAMRFGCAVTYHADSGDWQDWTDEGVIALYWMLCMENTQPIVGWNIINFDWPVIINNARLAGHNVLQIEHESKELIDLFDLIRRATGRWYSLESVAQHNLGRGKLADGQKAAEWLRSGEPEQIAKAFEYCRHDVQLTIDLHEILLRGEPLRLPPRARRQEINEVLWWLDGRTERIPDAMGTVSTR